MGVKGLWTILEPFGRRVDVKFLKGHIVVVDASIWVYQFKSALVSQNSEADEAAIRGACILGFLRRIAKLILMGVRPVFVFDGEASQLKKDTLRKRRSAEEDTSSAIRKNAERLLRMNLDKVRASDVGEAQTSGDAQIHGNHSDLASRARLVDRVELNSILSDEDDRVHIVETLNDSDAGSDGDYDPLQDREGWGFVRANRMNVQGFRALRRSVDELADSYRQDMASRNSRGASSTDTELEIAKLGREIMEVVRYVEQSMSEYDAHVSDLKESGEQLSIQYVHALYSALLDAQRKLASHIRYWALKQESLQGLDQNSRIGPQSANTLHPRQTSGSRLSSADVGNELQVRVFVTASAISSLVSKLRLVLAKEETPEMYDSVGSESIESQVELTSDTMRNRFPRRESTESHFERKKSNGPKESYNKSILSTQDYEWNAFQGDSRLVASREKISEILSGRSKYSIQEKPEGFQKGIGITDCPSQVTSGSEPVLRRESKWQAAARRAKAVGQMFDVFSSTSDSGADKAEKDDISNKSVESWIDIIQSKRGGHISNASSESRLGATRESPISVKSELEDKADVVDEPTVIDPRLVKTQRAPETDGLVKSVEFSVDLDSGEAEKCAGYRAVNGPRKHSRTRESSSLIESEKETPDVSDLGSGASFSVTADTSSGVQNDDFQLNDFLDSLESDFGRIDIMLGSERVNRAQNISGDLEPLDLESSVSDSLLFSVGLDVRELLYLLGVPFVDAAGDAEAECARIVELGFAFAAITEDSDALVYGCPLVVRHLFSSETFPEAYKSGDLPFSRSQLVSLALLLGCDFTPGVHGIGAVNATEVVARFPNTSDLVTFKQWAEAGKVVDRNQYSGSNEQYEKLHKLFRRHWVFPEDFPSEAVIEEFTNPRTGLPGSYSNLAWGNVNVEGLEKFLESFTPVDDNKQVKNTVQLLARKQQRNSEQPRIDQFFRQEHDRGAVVDRVESKRLRIALDQIPNRG